jgi:hypothetical protein
MRGVAPILVKTDGMARADLSFLADEYRLGVSTSPQHRVEVPAYRWGS